MSPPTTIQLIEYARANRPAKIDRAAGIIERVKVLGEAGNHEYPKATRERSRQLFEGARVYIDHPAKGSHGRSVRDRMGRLKNVREEGDGLYADWHFNPKHSLAEQVCTDAETEPDGWGFSINGDGRPQKPGSKLIEEITRLTSVDVVDSPATTAGLFESKGANTVKTTLRTILGARRAKLSEARREWLDALLEQDDMAPAVDAPMEMPAETPEAPEASDPAEALKAGFKAALTALVEAALSGELDEAAAIVRFKELLKTHGKLTSKAEPEKPAKKDESDDDSGGEGDDVAEQKRNEELERELGLRRLCEQSGVFFDKLSVGIREALAAPGLSDGAKKELIGAAKAQQKSERPRSGGPVPVREQKQETELPTDIKALGAWIRGDGQF